MALLTFVHIILFLGYKRIKYLVLFMFPIYVILLSVILIQQGLSTLFAALKKFLSNKSDLLMKEMGQAALFWNTR